MPLLRSLFVINTYTQGLQRIELDVSSSCNHTGATQDFPHGEPRALTQAEALRIKTLMIDARKKSAGPAERVGFPAEDTRCDDYILPSHLFWLRAHFKTIGEGKSSWNARISCTRSLVQMSESISRCVIFRSFTSIYLSLFRLSHVAIDIWSAGTILLSFLACKFPIFNANDDIEALMELAAILGKRKMEKCAQLHSKSYHNLVHPIFSLSVVVEYPDRTFATNVPAVDHSGLTWTEVVERFNPYLYYPTPAESATPSQRSQEEAERAEKHNTLIASALDLLTLCLDIDPTKRITAREALYHPFLEEPLPPEVEAQAQALGVELPGDDAFFPWPPGNGVCGSAHFVDPVTDEHCVRTARNRTRVLMAGEGIAIGARPCEFHTDGWTFDDDELVQDE